MPLSVNQVCFESLMEAFEPEAVQEDFARFRADPAGFGREILGHDYPDCICALMNSVVENRVTIAPSANGTGKSYQAGDLAAWWLLIYPDSKVVFSAYPYSQLQNILWPKVLDNYAKHKDVFANFSLKLDTGLFDRNNPEHCLIKLTIPNQGTIEERKAKISGYHAPHTLYIFDEADAIPKWVYETIETCMSGEHERLLCLFNPRRASGHMYQLEREDAAAVIRLSAFDHPNVVSGENLFPGAVTRAVTVRRINEYTRPLAPGEAFTRNCFAVPGFLVGETTENPNRRGVYYPPLPEGNRYVKNPQFSHMVLGVYPSQTTNQLVSQESIDAARDRWDEYVRIHGEKPPNEYAIMGQDVGELGTDASASCFRYPSSGFVERIVTWYGVDTLVTAENAIREYRLRKVRMANVDAIGVGSTVAPLMTRAGCKAYAVKVSKSATEFASGNEDIAEIQEMHRLRDQLIWLASEYLKNNPCAMLPPDDLLIEEMLAYVYWEDEEKGTLRVTKSSDIKELIGRSPDRFCAYYLTFYDPPTPTRRWSFD